MQEAWVKQMQNQVNTLERLEKYINVSDDERRAIEHLDTKWGVSPYFASLMDKDDPGCPIRKQVIPSMAEQVNEFGMDNYLIWKENRTSDDVRPDSIARQYRDRIAFTVVETCGIYCRHCFRKEVVVDQDLKLRMDADEGLKWIAEHTEVRDVLITGGDPLLLSDQKLEYLIKSLRALPHVEMIRIGSRLPIVLPQRITEGLKKAIGGFHRVPVWINTQCNHPKEI
ncbi:MAG: KamA family radical SAM protein, partial [Nitrospinota bacterium]